MNQRRKRRRDLERWRKNQPVWGKSRMMNVFEWVHYKEVVNDSICRSFQIGAFPDDRTYCGWCGGKLERTPEGCFANCGCGRTPTRTLIQNSPKDVSCDEIQITDEVPSQAVQKDLREMR